MANLRIGALAECTGATAPTIRYYEEVGLLRQAARQSGGQRVYDENDVQRLTFIRRCRDFGFSIEQVKSLVALMEDPNRSCMEARDLAQQHFTAVRAKVRELKELERRLASFVACCDSTCAGGPGPDCVILDELGETASNARPGCESGS